MREWLAVILLIVGFWHPVAWLLAWAVGRPCRHCDEQRKRMEILQRGTTAKMYDFRIKPVNKKGQTGNIINIKDHQERT